MKSDCHGKFVSQKVSRMRWVPKSGVGTVRAHWAGAGSHFITGAWDQEFPSLTLWQCPDETMRKSDLIKKAELRHPKDNADVNDIRFVAMDMFCTASSTGHVSLIGLKETDEACQMFSVKSLYQPEGRPSSCNDLDIFDRFLFSAFNNGDLRAFDTSTGKEVRALVDADSCCLNAVVAVKQEEILTANIHGQVKLLDLKAEGKEPAITSNMRPHSESIGISCLAKHPTQTHIVGSGSLDGMVSFWDLRQMREPVTKLKGHTQAVTEIVFHQNQPDHMFTSSESGEVWHWNGSAASRLNPGNQIPRGPSDTIMPQQTNLWFNNEAVKHRVETTNLIPRQLLPINCIDSMGTSLIAGGDNEVIYCISNLVV